MPRLSSQSSIDAIFWNVPDKLPTSSKAGKKLISACHLRRRETDSTPVTKINRKNERTYER